MSDIRFVGYIEQPGVDVGEYGVVFERSWSFERVADALERKTLPPGVVLRDDYGTTAIVQQDGTLRRIA